MIDHIWTVVCSMSVTDKETNNISLFNVIEQLTILTQPQPNMIPQFSLDIVTLWGRSDDAITAQGCSRVTLVSPSGEEIGQGEGEIDLVKHERLRARRRFPLGLNLKDAGRYYFRIELKLDDEEEWHTVAKIPLKVTIESPPSDEA